MDKKVSIVLTDYFAICSSFIHQKRKSKSYIDNIRELTFNQLEPKISHTSLSMIPKARCRKTNILLSMTRVVAKMTQPIIDTRNNNITIIQSPPQKLVGENPLRIRAVS
ncbi:hypothetical protein Hanom_Chr10g00920601 [Helianthus anomalus]